MTRFRLSVIATILLILSGCERSTGKMPDANAVSDTHTLNELTKNLTGLDECVVVDALTGTICGRLLAANNVTPLSGVTLSLPSAKEPSSCITDADGRYACNVPERVSRGFLTAIVASSFWYPDRNLAIQVHAGTLQDVSDYSMGRWWHKTGKFLPPDR